MRKDTYQLGNYKVIVQTPDYSVPLDTFGGTIKRNRSSSVSASFAYTNSTKTFSRSEIKWYLTEDMDNSDNLFAVIRAAELVGGYDNLVLFNSLKAVELINELSEQKNVPWELVERAYLACKLKINYLQEDGSLEEVEQIYSRYSSFLDSRNDYTLVKHYTLNVDSFAFKPRQ